MQKRYVFAQNIRHHPTESTNYLNEIVFSDKCMLRLIVDVNKQIIRARENERP